MIKGYISHPMKVQKHMIQDKYLRVLRFRLYVVYAWKALRSMFPKYILRKWVFQLLSPPPTTLSNLWIHQNKNKTSTVLGNYSVNE